MPPGFARAVQPISTATITTDAHGLVADDVRIPACGIDMPAYCAMPDADGPFPVVLVVHEVFGVHEHIRDICRRFAKLGYFAVAPDLYARQGDPSQLASLQEIIPFVSKVPDAQVMSDLDATVEWAGTTGKADLNRLGITGFCWGGRIVWLWAAHTSRLKAGAAWYGRLLGSPDELHPKHPLDVAGSLQAPVLGLYGGQDTSIPVNTVAAMNAALKQAGSPSEILVYHEAGHAFYADYRPGYHKQSAGDGWKRMLEWFKKYGVA